MLVKKKDAKLRAGQTRCIKIPCEDRYNELDFCFT
jgi:hypothetical protein